MTRQCGDCQLCCKLLPMSSRPPDHFKETKRWLIENRYLDPNAIMTPDFDKPAGARCPHQRHHKGCAIYAVRPFGCRLWSCVWLTDDKAGDLSRPDRSHYVIDPSPDYITCVDHITGHEQNVPVIQVWVDPDYPDAHRDPALRRLLAGYCAKGVAALIRYDKHTAIALALDENGNWREVVANSISEPEHTARQKVEVLGPMRIVEEDQP